VLRLGTAAAAGQATATATLTSTTSTTRTSTATGVSTTRAVIGIVPVAATGAGKYAAAHADALADLGKDHELAGAWADALAAFGEAGL